MTELLPFKKHKFGAKFEENKSVCFALKPLLFKIVNNTKNELNSVEHFPTAQ